MSASGGMKITMGSHLTNAADLSNDWGPALFIWEIRDKIVIQSIENSHPMDGGETLQCP